MADIATGAGSRYTAGAPSLLGQGGEQTEMEQATEGSTQKRATRGAETESIVDVREVLSSLWRFKWVVLALAVAAGIATALWTYKQPKIYEAACSLEYDPNPPKPLQGAIQDVADPLGSFWNNREFFETQNLVIASREIAQRVVRKLRLHHDASFMGIPLEARSGWTGGDENRAAMGVQGAVTVDQVPDTRLVRVRVRDQSPERAALIANAIAEAYIEKSVEDRLGSTITAIEWLTTQLDNVQRNLAASEGALHRFKEEHDVLSVDLEDRQNIVANNLERLSTSLTEIKEERIVLAARAERLKKELEAFQQGQATTPLGVDVDSIRAIRAQLNDVQAKRDTLSVRYGQQHPDILALDAQFKSLSKQLVEEMESITLESAADLGEVKSVEVGLKAAMKEVNQAGLQLNLREIEYNRLRREKENNEKLYDILLQRTTEANLTKMLRVTHAHVIDRALPPTASVSPNLRLNVTGGILGGVLLGMLLAVFLTRMDRTVKTAEELEEMGLTPLGLIPRFDLERNTDPSYAKGNSQIPPAAGDPTTLELFVHTFPMSTVAECCRTIRTNLVFMSPDRPLRSLVVTSHGPREGKTTTAVSLAITMAQSGKRTLLVDVDLRRPRVHRVLRLSSATGTTNYVVGGTPLKELTKETEVPNLWALPCGPIPPNPSELLHTVRFQQLLEDAKGMFDFVLLDTPPLGAVTDAAIAAPQVDGVVIVAQSNSTHKDALRSAVRQLDDVGANVVGSILNDVDLDKHRKGYSHYYYYNKGAYYAQPEDEDKDEPSAEADRLS